MTKPKELNKIKKKLFKLFLIFLILSPSFVHAANLRDQISGQVNAGATSAGFGAAKDPRQIVGEVINIALGVTGSVFIVLILMAGYWYITAKGDESKVEKATKTIRGAIIGLIVVLMAYSITRFVSYKSQAALRDTPRDTSRGFLDYSLSDPPP